MEKEKGINRTRMLEMLLFFIIMSCPVLSITSTYHFVRVLSPLLLQFILFSTVPVISHASLCPYNFLL